jgi:hypothetical protein
MKCRLYKYCIELQMKYEEEEMIREYKIHHLAGSFITGKRGCLSTAIPKM